MTGLFVYPVKSLGAVAVESAVSEARGLRHDRRLMLVDAEGAFQTQRRLARMARLKPSFLEDGRLRIDGFDGTHVELDPARGGERVPVQVWDHHGTGIYAWPETDEWFTRKLGLPVRLVRMADDDVRRPNPKVSREYDEVGFADGFPVLLCSEESLGDLNSRLESPVPMDRFRPNVVISGALPWEEEAHFGWRLGEAAFRFAKPCIRCRVTTLDQTTGDATGAEPLRTLATFRRWGGGVTFGANLLPDGPGTIRVGDEVGTIAGGG